MECTWMNDLSDIVINGVYMDEWLICYCNKWSVYGWMTYMLL